MEEMIFYDSAKENVTSFFEKEFPNFPPLIISNFLNKFNDFLNYSEEGMVIRPKIVFTNNIESVVKSIPKANILPVFSDPNPTMFNSRLKSLLAIAEHNWLVYVDIKDTINYGLVMSFGSIKDKDAISCLLDNSSLKDKSTKISCIVARALNFYTMSLHSISDNDLTISFALDKSKFSAFNTEIGEFVDATFSKLRTTQRKLQDMKTMYLNIFSHVMSDIQGTICVIVDKDYEDNGFFSDGIWLKEPISFSKLFTQSKSYDEEKLRAFTNLFINMLNFDGITIVDNKGRLRAFNVFVEPNNKRVGYIVGGARKRAAYSILSSKRKGIIGVYFQSHDGEVFYHEYNDANKLKAKKLEQKKQEAREKLMAEKMAEKQAKVQARGENDAVILENQITLEDQTIQNKEDDKK